MKLSTNILLTISILVIAGIFIVATIPEFFGMSESNSIILVLDIDLWD